MPPYSSEETHNMLAKVIKIPVRDTKIEITPIMLFITIIATRHTQPPKEDRVCWKCCLPNLTTAAPNRKLPSLSYANTLPASSKKSGLYFKSQDQLGSEKPIFFQLLQTYT